MIQYVICFTVKDEKGGLNMLLWPVDFYSFFLVRGRAKTFPLTFPVTFSDTFLCWVNPGQETLGCCLWTRAESLALLKPSGACLLCWKSAHFFFSSPRERLTCTFWQKNRVILRIEPKSALLHAFEILAHPSVQLDWQARLYWEDPRVNAFNPAVRDSLLGLHGGDLEGLDICVGVWQLVNPKPGQNKEKCKFTKITTHFSLFRFKES